MKPRLLAGFLLISLLSSSLSIADSLLRQLENSPYSALLVSSAAGKKIYSLRPDMPLVPASTLKILTALIAIEHWGLTHRFHTDFYLDNDNALAVKGFGDPFLISEEIALIAEGLQQTGQQEFSSIVLDTTAFGSDIKIDGQSRSHNPYDAPPGAIAANFNTIFLSKRGTRIKSMESQTPITAVAREVSRSVPEGQHRINIKNPDAGARHFAEILRTKLLARKIRSGKKILVAAIPEGAKLIYRHQNSHSLEEILTAMLKYSTNFVANQLFLMLAAESQPASVQSSRQLFESYIQQHFSWQNSHVEEGAGLSRNNRISANQLVALLERFRPYRHLLPTTANGILGKTGTVNGISSYAGYLTDDLESPAFALLINDAKIAGSRKSLLKVIKQRWGAKNPEPGN